MGRSLAPTTLRSPSRMSLIGDPETTADSRRFDSENTLSSL